MAYVGRWIVPFLICHSLTPFCVQSKNLLLGTIGRSKTTSSRSGRGSRSMTKKNIRREEGVTFCGVTSIYKIWIKFLLKSFLRYLLFHSLLYLFYLYFCNLSGGVHGFWTSFLRESRASVSVTKRTRRRVFN